MMKCSADMLRRNPLPQVKAKSRGEPRTFRIHIQRDIWRLGHFGAHPRHRKPDSDRSLRHCQPRISEMAPVAMNMKVATCNLASKMVQGRAVAAKPSRRAAQQMPRHVVRATKVADLENSVKPGG